MNKWEFCDAHCTGIRGPIMAWHVSGCSQFLLPHSLYISFLKSRNTNPPPIHTGKTI